MFNPLISVVVPIYNVQDYLSECIDSILSQTYTNLEIILVDDGATDDCPHICEVYAKKDFRIKVIHKENGGLSDARNVGIEVSKGEYLVFVDSDDIVSKYFVERLYSAITLFSVDLAVCGVFCFSEKKCLSDESSATMPILLSKKKSLELFCSLNFGKSTPFIAAWSKIYRRSIFDEIVFPVGRIYEDALVGYKVIDREKNVAFVPDALYYYRMRSDGIMGGKEKHAYQDVLKPYQDAISYFDENNQNDLAMLFYPPLLMREMYRYWVAKVVENNGSVASEILQLYQKDVKKLKGTKINFVLKFIFEILAWKPGIYTFYRKIAPGLVGGR